MPSEERKPYAQRFEALKAETSSWTPTWQEIKKFIAPTRGTFSDMPNRGDRIDHRTIIDDTAQRASKTFASGMQSGLTSPARPWFKLRVASAELMKKQAVKEWCAEVERRIYTVLGSSNLYEVLYNIYEELAAFGTASAIILRDYKTVVRGMNFTIGEFFLGAGADNRVNSWAREFYMTAGQLVSEFGREAVSETVLKAFDDNKPDAWFRVCHLVEPNDERIPDRSDFLNMPYRSVYWEADSSEKPFLARRGFEQFPILGPRYGQSKTSDIYGKDSPGWNSLGNAKMLQLLHKDKLLAIAKVIKPPMQQDATVQGQINDLPGGITHTSGTLPNAGVQPLYQIQPDVAAINETINDTRNEIEKDFYTNLFLMMTETDRRDISATEVVERHEEKLLMLGPLLIKLQSELLDRLIDIVFSIMMEVGMIPEAPAELQGLPLRVEYVSVLAQAQKAVGVTAMEQVAAMIGNLGAVVPEVMDKLDADAYVDNYADFVGSPANIIRDRDTVTQIRQERARAMQAQQQAADAAAMVQGAKVLSDTKVGQDSALDAILGGIGAPQGGQGI